MELVTFCTSIDVYCLYCNVVNHIACLQDIELPDVYKGTWMCQDCTDDLQDSKNVFVNNRMKVATKIQRDNAQKIIAKHMRRYIHR